MIHARMPFRETICALASLAFAALIGGCGGAPAVPATVKSTPTAAAGSAAPPATAAATATEVTTPSAGGEQLRDLAAQRGFYVGAAVSVDALRNEPAYAELLARTYNQVTPENVMKFGPIHPARDRFNWNDADALVAFAEAHGMRVHGHTLVWHQQLASWVTQGNLTADAARAYREVLQACLAAPNCGEFTTWGFTDKYSWVPQFFSGYGAALPFDEHYAPKPAYTALVDELSKQ
jgi:GH35 family endo-1,4-beta-xylanase